MTTNFANWTAAAILIAAVTVYFAILPSPLQCTKYPDADVSKPASDVLLMPWEFHNEDCRRCHTGPVAEVPPGAFDEERPNG
jgi:hypothetical protein